MSAILGSASQQKSPPLQGAPSAEARGAVTYVSNASSLVKLRVIDASRYDQLTARYAACYWISFALSYTALVILCQKYSTISLRFHEAQHSGLPQTRKADIVCSHELNMAKYHFLAHNRCVETSCRAFFRQHCRNGVTHAFEVPRSVVERVPRTRVCCRVLYGAKWTA